MSLAPLQLQHSHFVSLSVDTEESALIAPSDYGNEPYPPASDMELDVDVKMGLLSSREDLSEYVIQLTLRVTPRKDSQFPYRISAQMEGFFLFKHTGDINERNRMVVINGASILYGAVREQLLTLTGRHKAGPVMLPSYSFREFGPAEPTKSEEKATLKTEKTDKAMRAAAAPPRAKKRSST